MSDETTAPALAIRPLSPALMDDFGAVLRGNFGAGCWCMYPRMRDAELAPCPTQGSYPGGTRRNDGAGQRQSGPALLAYAGMNPCRMPANSLGSVVKLTIHRPPAYVSVIRRHIYRHSGAVFTVIPAPAGT